MCCIIVFVEGYYLNTANGGGCLPCDCYGAGTIDKTFCDPQTGMCECLGGSSGIAGRRCESCAENYYGQAPR